MAAGTAVYVLSAKRRPAASLRLTCSECSAVEGSEAGPAGAADMAWGPPLSQTLFWLLYFRYLVSSP